MLNNLSMKQKILYGFLTVSLLPLLIISFMAFVIATNSVEEEVKHKLEATLSSKKAYLETYFDVMQQQLLSWGQGGYFIDAVQDFNSAITDIQIKDYSDEKLKSRYTYQKRNTENIASDAAERWWKVDDKAKYLQHLYIAENKNKIGEKQKLTESKDGSWYSDVHMQYHDYFKDIQEKFELYDLFIIEPKEGRIVYSVFKELDYATRLFDGPYKNSGLADVARKAFKFKAGDFAVSDFKVYEPSYNAQAAFMATPIIKDGKTLGVVAIQFPLDKLTEIMNNRDGLGETGHFYFIDDDARMRNNTILSKTATIGKTIQNAAVDRVLTGESGFMEVVGFSGNDALSAFTPISLKGFNWYLLSEQDKKEAFSSIELLRNIFITILAITIIAVAVVSVMVAKNIQRPVNKLMCEFDGLSNYQLDSHLDKDGGEDMQELADKFNTFIDKLNNIVYSVQDLSGDVEGSSESISDRMSKIALMSEEQRRAVNEIADAVQGASTFTNEINDLARNAVQSVATITEKTTQTSQDMKALSDSVRNINEVVEVINDISDQTNLLALNAAIEAARAGDEGRGFAVVAEEVRKLASKTSESTQMIGSTIEQLISKSDSADVAMQEIQSQVDGVRGVFENVGDSVQQQSAMIEEISATMHEFSTSVDVISEDVQGANGNTKEMTGVAKSLREQVNVFQARERHNEV